MLQYRRRNSTISLQHRTVTARHPLVTYCNWSHHRSRHINESSLRDMLSRFQDRHIPFYLRMINETPRSVVDSFIDQENLDSNTFENIYQALDTRGFDLRRQ